MAAPEGNQFYKIALANGNAGRPALFSSPEIVAQKWKEYQTLMESEVIYKTDFVKSGPTAGELVSVPCRVPYTIEGFCLSCGITARRFNQIISDETCKELLPILLHVQESIRNDQIKGGLVGTLNPMLVARINGLKEQQEVSGEIKNTVTQINFVQRTIEDTTFVEVQTMIEDL